jgi:hypothetical protein
MDEIKKTCNYRVLGNLYNRMVYMYVWVDKIKAVYFGLTCDEEKRYKQHVFNTSLGEVETTPGCRIGDSAVRDFINQHGPYDDYYDISKGYVVAEKAAAIEKLGIAYFRKVPEFSGFTVVNKTDGGELGGRYSLNARQAITDAAKIIEDKIENPEQLKSKYPDLSDYWVKTPDRKRIFNKQLKRRFFEDAPYEINELLDIVKDYDSFTSLKISDKRAARSLSGRKKMMGIVFPTEKIFYDEDDKKMFNTLKEVSEHLNVNFVDLFHDFLKGMSEMKYHVRLITIDEYEQIKSEENKIVESVLKRILKSRSYK